MADERMENNREAERPTEKGTRRKRPILIAAGAMFVLLTCFISGVIVGQPSGDETATIPTRQPTYTPYPTYTPQPEPEPQIVQETVVVRETVVVTESVEVTRVVTVAAPESTAAQEEVARYGNTMSILLAELYPEELSALLSNPQPSERGWLLNVGRYAGHMESLHIALSSIHPPPTMAEVHDAFVDATADPALAAELLVDGLAERDADKINAATELMLSGGAKIRAATELIP